MTKTTVKSIGVAEQLWFTPYAWAKLLGMCHYSDNEVGAMGLANAEDPLLIEDLWIPKQTVSPVSTKFDMEDFAAGQLQICDPTSTEGRHPRCVRRVWIHTHPQGVHSPSRMDEQTFNEVVGNASWGVMFIMAKDGQTYCRLRMRSADLQVERLLTVGVAWAADFPAHDHRLLAAELQTKLMDYEPVLMVPEAPTHQLTTTKLVYVSAPSPVVDIAPKSVYKPTEPVVRKYSSPPRTPRVARNLRLIAHTDSVLSGVHSRQIPVLLTEEAKLSEITNNTFSVLAKAGVRCVNDTVSGDRQALAMFGHEELGARQVPSTGLLSIDRIKLTEEAVLSGNDWDALEDDLRAMTMERMIGVAGHTDTYDEPLEVGYPWLTHTGDILLLSENEISSLLDEITGEFVDSGATASTPIGFHDMESEREPVAPFVLDEESAWTEFARPRDPTAAFESLGQTVSRLADRTFDGDPWPDALERAVKEIMIVVEDARQEGATVECIESNLARLSVRAQAEGWLPEAVIKIKELRKNGYSLIAPKVVSEQQQVNSLLLNEHEGPAG